MLVGTSRGISVSFFRLLRPPGDSAECILLLLVVHVRPTLLILILILLSSPGSILLRLFFSRTLPSAFSSSSHPAESVTTSASTSRNYQYTVSVRRTGCLYLCT